MKRLPILLLLLSAVTACDDIFEKDLAKSQVSVIAPSDNLRVAPGEVTFVWHEVEGANSYHLRIVAGTFGGDSRAVADTVLFNDSTGGRRSYKKSLPEDEYQWSIVARNGSSITVEKIYNLSVSAPKPDDISGLQIRIAAPGNLVTLPPGDVVFGWEEVPGADSYRFTLVSPSFDDVSTLSKEITLHKDSEAPCNSITVNLAEGTYQWKVKAFNKMYETAEKISSFAVAKPREPGPVDISGAAIEIIAPHHNASLEPGEVTFLWREVKGATSYHITVVGPAFDAAKVVVADQTLTGGSSSPPRSFKATIPPGRYQWSLKAMNEQYETAERIFSFEVAAPGEP